MPTRITISELDRNMSDIFNRVAYRGESFIIERGGKEVALLEPPRPRLGATLDEIIAKMGDLHVPEGMGKDLEDIKASIPKLELPRWLDE